MGMLAVREGVWAISYMPLWMYRGCGVVSGVLAKGRCGLWEAAVAIRWLATSSEWKQHTLRPWNYVGMIFVTAASKEMEVTCNVDLEKLADVR